MDTRVQQTTWIDRGEEMKMHPNTKRLMDWGDRMIKKFGHPKTGYDWCRKLAYSVGEEGNDYPSNYAITIAKKWEKSTFRKN